MAKVHLRKITPDNFQECISLEVDEIVAGIGFIMRLMVDRKYQRKGYGRAAMQKVIRRLKLYPEVELIATSYLLGNETASKLYRSLGFVDWEIEWALNHKSDIFLKLNF